MTAQKTSVKNVMQEEAEDLQEMQEFPDNISAVFLSQRKIHTIIQWLFSLVFAYLKHFSLNKFYYDPFLLWSMIYCQL